MNCKNIVFDMQWKTFEMLNKSLSAVGIDEYIMKELEYDIEDEINSIASAHDVCNLHSTQINLEHNGKVY